MPTFAYQARTQQGKKVFGTVEAVSEHSLADQLKREGYFITSIKATDAHSHQASLRVSSGGRVGAAQLSLFYFQLGNMLEAGVPLLASLKAVQKQSTKQFFKQVVLMLATQVEQGVRFSDALTRYPRIFPELYRAMIQVGETSGNLDLVLKQVAELNERNEKLRHEIFSALAYPVVLVCASIAVVTFMIVWIVPSFSAIFLRAGVPLPLPTRLLYGFSMWVKSNVWFLAVAAIAFGFGAPFLLRFEKFKYGWDRFWLSVPIVGQLISQIEISLWARNVALMHASGVPILKTLEMTGKLAGNLPFQRVLIQARVRVQAGEKLGETIKEGGIFPPDIVQMVLTGEQSGNLDKMLYKAALFYDELLTRTLKQLTSAIEPIFIVFMGIVVGFIMISVLLPIFDMLKLF